MATAPIIPPLDPAHTQSANLLEGNLAQLKALFPEAFKEGGIDFEVLKQLLGGQVDEREEKYGLNWHGKRRARQIALTPSAGTLRPCPQDSVDWDTTQNLMIEGDNLEVLKLLQKSYAGKVKMIYIDPPYNTGKDFVYPDNFTDNIKNYLELTGQTDGQGRKLSSNTESSGRFHTDWLNMMYPRLKLARNLLREDGVIFISIDHNEVATLTTLMNEVYGEENSLIPLIWSLPRGINAGHVSKAHEYLIAFCRNKELLNHFRKSEEAEYSVERCNKKIDARHPASEITFPAGIRYEGPDKTFRGVIDGSEKITIAGELIFRSGRLHQEAKLTAGWTMKQMIQDWLDGKSVVDTKGQKIVDFYFKENGKLYSKKEVDVQSIKSVLRDAPDTQVGRKEIEELLGSEDIFDYPKPSGLIQKLVALTTQHEDIVLDLFAGSGTTGHAVMTQNSVDSEHRRYLVVQLPEHLDPDVKDQALALEFCDSIGKPRNIAELTKERLRRAAIKIRASRADSMPATGQLSLENEPPEAKKPLNLGFKVFKLDTSNIRAWNPNPDELEGTLMAQTEHLTSGRSEGDVLYEILLKQGLDLALPLQKKRIAGHAVHNVGAGALLVCLARDGDDKNAMAEASVTPANAEALALGMADWHAELAAALGQTPAELATRVVLRDSLFDGDVAKTNLTAILRQRGLEDVRSL